MLFCNECGTQLFEERQDFIQCEIQSSRFNVCTNCVVFLASNSTIFFDVLKSFRRDLLCET
jgi:hypothetical protein